MSSLWSARALVLGVVLAALTWLMSDVPAMAATIQVTTSADENGTGAACSLREAIQAATTDGAFGGCPAGDAGTDKIPFASVTTDTPIVVTSAITIATDVQLVGNGVQQTRIDGNSGNSGTYT